MEPAIRSVSGPEAWGLAEILQFVGVFGIFAGFVALGVLAFRSASDSRDDPKVKALNHWRHRRGKAGVFNDPDDEAHRDKLSGPISGVDGGGSA